MLYKPLLATGKGAEGTRVLMSSHETVTFEDMHDGKPVSEEFLIAKHTDAMEAVVIPLPLLLLQDSFLRREETR